VVVDLFVSVADLIVVDGSDSTIMLLLLLLLMLLLVDGGGGGARAQHLLEYTYVDIDKLT
jgi:hypothetical protein